MTETQPGAASSQEPCVVQIRVRGHLGRQWQDWFDGWTIQCLDNGDTLLTGQVADQAALFGLLHRVRDVGLPLLSVAPVEPNAPPAAQPPQETF